MLRLRKEGFKFCDEKEETSGKFWKDGWRAKNKQRRYYKGVSFHFRDAVEWRFGERQVWSRCDGEGIEMSSQGFEEQIRGCRMDGK